MANNDSTIADLGYASTHKLGPGPATPEDAVNPNTQTGLMESINYIRHRHINRKDYLEGLNGEFPAVILSAEKLSPDRFGIIDGLKNWAIGFLGGDVPNEIYTYKVYTVYTHGHLPWEEYVDETNAGDGKVSWLSDSLPDAEQANVIADNNSEYAVNDMVLLAYQDQANLKRPYIKSRLGGSNIVHEAKASGRGPQSAFRSESGLGPYDAFDCRSNNQDCNNGHYVGKYSEDPNYPKNVARGKKSSSRQEFFEPIARRVARDHGIPEDGFVMQLNRESAGSWDPCVPAGYKDSNGRWGPELGMAQFMPGTAKSYNMKVGEKDAEGNCIDERSDVDKSLNAAAKYMKANYDQIRNSDWAQAAGVPEEEYWALAAMGYNAGMGKTKNHVKSGKWKAGQQRPGTSYGEEVGAAYGATVPWKKKA